MVKRRTGLDPLAYMGVEPSTPAQFIQDTRNPTITDYDNFDLMAVWLNLNTFQVWMLVNKADFIATWIPFSTSIGALNVLTADTGTNPVPPTLNNINIFGGTGINTVGDIPSSTITINADGSLATEYDADIGSAIPSGNILNIIGGPHVQTTGSGNTITIEAAGTIAVSVHTDSGNAVPSGGVLNVFGLAGHNISTSGSGNTVDIAVSGTTNHAVQIGNSTGSLTSLSVGLDGQVIIGATAADPAFAYLTSTGGTIAFTTGPNSLNLETVGAGFLTDIVCDVGDAAPIGGILNVLGGDNITTTGDTMNTIHVAVSGTGQFAPQMGNAAGSLSDIGFMTDGQVIIGATGVAPVINTLTAGTGISITNAPGMITIDATGSSVGDTIVTIFNSSGTWTKNTNTKYVTFYIYSGGGGGGSGAKGATSSGGGSGAAGRGLTTYSIPAFLTPATASITIAASAPGGAGQTVNSTNGINGTNANYSYIDTIPGGNSATFGTITLYGTGGLATGNTSPSNSPGVSGYYCNEDFSTTVGTPGSGSGNGGGDASFTQGFGSPTSGGGGGGVSSTFAPGGTQGGNAAPITMTGINILNSPVPTFGVPGTGGAIGVSGTNGADASTTPNMWMLGGMGGGGGGGHPTNPGHGGNGGFPGGGAGGGAGCINGATTSGSGGTGAAGQVIIVEFTGM